MEESDVSLNTQDLYNNTAHDVKCSYVYLFMTHGRGLKETAAAQS